MAKRNRIPAPATKPIEWGDLRAQRVAYESDATIFRQGDPCTTVMYVQAGSVRLSVVSHAGKEAVIAILDAGDFFGEACLTGQSVRTATATAISACSVLRIRRQEITRKLHSDESFSDSFVGTTRPRVNFFMNKFRQLGFIEYDASGVKVNRALLGVILAE
jgi:signal-transduction protein with cAMP-binding, CBS, and nucleotidyltransferase domain